MERKTKEIKLVVLRVTNNCNLRCNWLCGGGCLARAYACTGRVDRPPG